MEVEKNKQHSSLRALYLLKLICKSWLELLPHGVFILPYLKSCPAGNSQHSGAISLNSFNSPKGLYLIDTSGLSYIPGTPTTALAMAHAMYIGDYHE
jgi:hypothetical protein